MTTGPFPGTWQPGDDPGRRQFTTLDGAGRGFTLDGGGYLPEVTVAYETWGRLDDTRSNAVLVSHALSGDSHAVGPAGPGHVTPGWWDAMIGPGAPLDTDRFFVVCPNVLGGCQGTTGPSSPDGDGVALGSRFPIITIRDQVAVEAALSDALGIARWHAIVGGSMGGMRALEWAATYPERVARAVVLAVGAVASAEQIALCSLQVRTIRADANFLGGDYYATGARPIDGLAIARGLGHLSYRTAEEMERRFARSAQGSEDPLAGGRYAVESYLEYHGDKLAARFDANSYIVLSEAMNHHDVGRGRGGVARALEGVSAQTTVVGIASDRLYPVDEQWELTRLVPGARAPIIIESGAGHDGFLLETTLVGDIVEAAINE